MLWVLQLTMLVVFAQAPAQSSSDAQDNLERCKLKATEIRVGMTRADVFKLMSLDGGIQGIYQSERYAFKGAGGSFTDARGYGIECKLNIDFRPHGISDDDYNDPNRFLEWQRASSLLILTPIPSAQPEREHTNLVKRVWKALSHPFAGNSPKPEQRTVLHYPDPADEVVKISPAYLESPIFD